MIYFGNVDNLTVHIVSTATDTINSVYEKVFELLQLLITLLFSPLQALTVDFKGRVDS